MYSNVVEGRIETRGKEFFSSIQGEKPSLFDKGAWMGKVMDWCMQNESFKVRMFRFVDVFPSLTNGRVLTAHIRQYFDDAAENPTWLSWGAKAASCL